MPARQLPLGALLGGRYRIEELIGESDLSAVFTASDQRGHTQVALKVFDGAVMGRAAALSEYQAQARQASSLGVEGIARAYDFGIDANLGSPFSTAERVSWASLDRRVATQGPLGATELSRALTVLARALDAAHVARLVHRDLKPQNVFISPDNPEWVRITDFGMSAVRRGAPEAMGWGGPPGYTPPDAVDAAAAGSPAVDIFALGVIAFFALTRGTPFRSLRSPTFDPTAHWSELNQPLHPVSERAKEIGVALDPSFDPWFARALALAPHDRFPSAGAMAQELGRIADQLGARGAGGPRSMPGIAAAIAQPLVFQPEPSAASLGLAATSPAAPSPFAAPAAAAVGSPSLSQPAASGPAALAPTNGGLEPIAGLPKKGAPPLALLIGAAVVLLGGLALAGYAALGGKSDAKPEPSAVSSITASTPPAAAPAPAPTGPARARFTCEPGACDWVVCDGKNVNGLKDEIEFSPGSHECSASKNGYGSKSLTFTATPGQVTAVLFELPPLPEATREKAAAANAALTGSGAPTSPQPATTAAKPAAAAKPATAAAKPATAAAKPAVSKTTSKPQKKCSTFLGCK